MKILLAGDSKLSWNIINELINKQNSITVINKDMTYCQQLADQHEEILILNADSTDLQALQESNIKKFDMVIAMSPNDCENFIICELCKKFFCVRNTAAIINCTQNSEIFRNLGVNTVIDANTYILSCIS